jgi:hypothetical protein
VYDSKVHAVYDFSLIKEFKINSYIGCGDLEITLKDGDMFRLCRFTQSCISPLSEFIKATNYYITTGEYTNINLDKTICPKCGKRFIENSTICINCADKGSILKKFISLGKNHIPGFLLAGFMVLISNLIALIMPIINKELVDGYLSPASQGKAPWGDKNPVTMVIFFVLLMLG